jgi:hypothetical protein
MIRHLEMRAREEALAIETRVMDCHALESDDDTFDLCGSQDTVTESLEFRSGQEMWDWVMNGNPIPGMLTDGLTDEQRIDIRAVLDGMLRERSAGGRAAALTNPVHIGVGTK